MKLFEDEMTEFHAVRTEAEYKAVTRHEIREQKAADYAAIRRAEADAAFAKLSDLVRRRS